MGSVRRNFRQWWQIPRRAGDRKEDRRVSFLELFYDLVYVVLIAQLAHSLSTHLTLEGVFGFSFLFIIVWWAWVNGTLYHDNHGNNDIRTRVYTFLQMIAVVSMAIFAHDALGEGSVGFALSYAFFQLLLTILWWRTGVHDPEHGTLSRPYSIVFLINTLLFATSVFIDPPARFYLWGISIVLSILLPAILMKIGRKNPEAQKQLDITANATPSLVERFGLFMIIVLGEIVVAVVSGISALHIMDIPIVYGVVLGTMVAVSIWWLYFDSVSHRLPKKGARMFASWYYLHLPMTMGIAAIGASLLALIEHAGEIYPEAQILMVSALALVLVCIYLLTRTVAIPKEHIEHVKSSRRVMLISALLILLVGLFAIDTFVLLTIIVILLLIPVLWAFIVWNSNIDQRRGMNG